MRICYFIPGPLSRGELGRGELERRRAFLQECVDGEVEADVREAPEGPASIESSVEEHLAVPPLLDALPSLEDEGFDAVIVGCFGDPGLDAARELVSIPVIGPAQASACLAAQLGDRFAILTVVEEVVPSLRRLMRAYGLDGLVSDLRAVDVPVLELRDRRTEVLQALVAEGSDAVLQGADSLVLGCMTMGFLDVAAELQERLETPVVNPVIAGLKTAESLVGCGLAPSRHAYPAPRKPPVATS